MHIPTVLLSAICFFALTATAAESAEPATVFEVSNIVSTRGLISNYATLYFRVWEDNPLANTTVACQISTANANTTDYIPCSEQDDTWSFYLADFDSNGFSNFTLELRHAFTDLYTHTFRWRFARLTETRPSACREVGLGAERCEWESRNVEVYNEIAAHLP